MSAGKFTAQSVVDYYRSIGMEAHVTDPRSINDVLATAICVDRKLADQLYSGAKPTKAASNDGAKAGSDESKRTAKPKPPKHAKKGSAEAKAQMTKLRAMRGKPSKRKQKQETTDHETTEQDTPNAE